MELDAAFHALGYSSAPRKATQELRALFRGQWANGLLPHIVFDPRHSADYMPGPRYWQTWQTTSDAPKTPETRGIVQPPVHATAALMLRDAGQGAGFVLGELLPKLVRWHDYLDASRDPDGDGLVYIRHPWESGMDNSPAWDGVFAAWELHPGDVPP